MEDYTKFKLKGTDELTQLLEQKDDLFVVSCNKCFKEFEAADEPECSEFCAFVSQQGKKLSGSAQIDFLCNKPMTEKKLDSAIPSGAKNICVISCGLGIQTVASIVEKPVYAAADSVSFDGRHGMALTKKRCDGCGQCYLNMTGGVCPIVDCSKSLVNGQCGGSKDFKCEVDKDKDCAWDKIYERLAAQNRTSALLGIPIQLRDHSKVNFKVVNDYVKSVREKRLVGFYGGLHPSENKEFSEHLPLHVFPSPKTVVIPLSQHAGAPAQPLVKAGDTVKLGQKIGESGGFISCTVHSSVSGTVTAVEDRLHPNTGLKCLSIVIDSDGKDEVHESVKPCADWTALSVDEIADLVREKGIVGMGGAGFPTSVKLKSPKPIDTILLNGCECEPLLTADHKAMLEYADDIIFGLNVMLKTTGAQKGVIVIEDNKRDAIEHLEAKTAHLDNIEVCVAATKYPQGAEKMLIKRALSRSVPSGALPLDVGVVVSNVSTVKAISDAIQTGMPLIERVLTVTGEKIKKPGNYVVKIGTSVKEIVDYCGGTTDDDTTIKLGGPMMGFEAKDLNVPVIKATNGIIAIEPSICEPNECIRCGRCADVCPMELLPLYYPIYAGTENTDGLKAKSVKDCMECGCCEFICSSRIPLRTSIKYGKKVLAETEGK
ncbi:MAG: electron transport complex subunit RsxC [Oscillospiraceae bacterium]|nr:electron transport complex subunit RsxC [Oscillospiraceae bacterium]